MSLSRREAREQAFALLFEKSFQPDETMADLISLNLENELIEADTFANGLAVAATENGTEIDAVIEKYSVGWRINRISKVSLAVLRLAICEILFYDDIPVGVSINEAVELCKKYASEDEYSFVNGILGSLSKEIGKDKN